MTNHTPEALISSISGDYFLGNDAELELAKNIVAQLSAVTAQRDELLHALKTLKESYLGAGDQMSREQRIAGRNALLAASTAIAKCEVKL